MNTPPADHPDKRAAALQRTGQLLFIASIFTVACCGQKLLSGSERGTQPILFPADMSVLETGEARNDLPCAATPLRPLFGFDLKFHAGYEVLIPLHELAGSGNLLTILFRVTPRDQDPVYFVQRYSVPDVEENARGKASLQGSFDLGEGSYRINWLMRDRNERVCSANWSVEVSLPAKDKRIAVALPADTVHPSETEQFQDEPLGRAISKEHPLNVKVLINFASLNPSATTLDPLETTALVSMLRTLSRLTQIGRFSLVAFSMQEQRVIYRQDSADHIDFPALGDSLRSLKLGTVDLKTLSRKHGDTEFLVALIKDETGRESHPDALIFAGPKIVLDSNVSQEDLKQIGELEYPVFYMNYNPSPETNPWRDAIGRLVKAVKGYEYTVSRPRDLWYSVTEMTSRIVQSKEARIAALADIAKR
jgi:hypothetical protein